MSDTELRRLCQDVCDANTTHAIGILRSYLVRHPEPAQPDAADVWANSRTPRRREPDAATGAQDERDVRIISLWGDVDRLAAERDAAQSEARHHADRCAALVAEVAGLRERLTSWLDHTDGDEHEAYRTLRDETIAALATPAASVPADDDGNWCRGCLSEAHPHRDDCATGWRPPLPTAKTAAPVRSGCISGCATEIGQPCNCQESTDSRAVSTEAATKGDGGGSLNPVPSSPARDADAEETERYQRWRELHGLTPVRSADAERADVVAYAESLLDNYSHDREGRAALGTLTTGIKFEAHIGAAARRAGEGGREVKACRCGIWTGLPAGVCSKCSGLYRPAPPPAVEASGERCMNCDELVSACDADGGCWVAKERAAAYARGLADAAGDVKRLRAALEAIRDGYGVDLDVRGIAARALAASKQP